MKKFLLFLLLAFVLVQANAQDETLKKFSKSYFRSDPFAGTFSGFLNHLLKDPSIIDKKIEQRTDTSFFYFGGKYLNFNPFFFKPKKVEVVLTETEVRYSEDSPLIDTIYVYQVIAQTDFTPEGMEEVKKEFNRILHQYKKKFYSSNTQDLTDKQGKVVGNFANFFIPYQAVAPITIAWGKMDGENSAVLNILIRLKSSDNYAVLPNPLYQSQ